MTDIWFPNWLGIARATPRYVDSTGASRSPYTGALKTASLGGDRLAVTMDVTPAGGQLASTERAALESFMMSCRGRQNRILFSSPSARLRGSFPATELFTNNTFASGTTGWSINNGTLSVTDRVARITATGYAASIDFFQSVTLAQYVPYVIRAFIIDGQTTSALSIGPSVGAGYQVTDYSTARGMRTLGVVSNSASPTSQFPVEIFAAAHGSYLLVAYTSMTRCPMVDNGQNLLTFSDQIDNTGAWPTVLNATIVANQTAGLDGATTADELDENTTNGEHYVQSANVTVSSAVQDFAFSVAIKSSSRTWALVKIRETLTSTEIGQYFNLSTGALGSTVVGANWGSIRAFITDAGAAAGWRICTVVGRKLNAATALNVRIGAATGDGGASYAGVGTQPAISMWRPTLSQSSLPTRLVQTTSAAVAATAQTGSNLFVKGLPASTTGLLLYGDWVQIGTQLNMVIAPLNSDAAGLGYLQCALPWRNSPSDNDPIIVNNPHGRFAYSGNQIEYENSPGIITTASLEFEEAA